MTIKEFSSLHNHSHFSVMDGISLPEEIILTAKEKGLTSIAITDHGHAHAHADMYLLGKKHGVKTILGVEAYVISDLNEWNELRERRDTERKNKGKSVITEGDDFSGSFTPSDAKKLKRKGHLVILACNRTGLSNLYDIVYRAHRDGFYGKPRCDKKMLREHSAGLVATSACMGGVVSNKCWEYRDGNCSWDEVVNEAREFDEIFGRGRFFLELQFNEADNQRYINDCLIKIHHETGIPLTVTADSHYIDKDGWKTQEILYMLRGKKSIQTRGDDWSFDVKQLYIKSPEEMWESFLKFGGSIPHDIAIEAFRNTLLVDSLVEDFEPDTHQRLPTLDYDNPFAEMGKRAIDGLKALGLADNDEYKRQLLYEFKIIKEKNIANYFLITQKIIEEAKKTQYVGAGRGSAAGSLVCYALGITDLDPVSHGLMFERFLDPSRPDVPDIDVDFEDVDATKDMLRGIFGNDNVACLSTYGTFQIKGLMKDLSRVYGLDHTEVNKVNKKIQSELRALYGEGEDKSSIVIKLEDVKRVSKSFNDFVAKYPEVGDNISALYGRNRHVGRHASGVVIGDDLKRETAIFTSKGVVQTSFTEGIVNKNLGVMGFVKFDILSIATLKILHHAVKLIAARTGKTEEEIRESLRPHNLDMNDPKVMKKIFWEGNECGVFQFSNKGIRRLAKQVKPESFEDISAITSLYRPGPLNSGMHKIFISNKKDPSQVSYAHPILEDILKDTRGTMIYQEQLMKVCQLLGKMELKDVQRIRKNLLKKIKGRSEEFLKNEDKELSGKFITGCMENGLTEEAAKQWWSDIKGWGSYGFNKSHSKTYSVMTMQCAHLATYYPIEFYAAVLSKGQASEKQDYVSDIKRRGIKVLPVDINKSGFDNTVEGEDIRLSLSSVLGVGQAAIAKIVKNQPYNNFIDFLDRSGVGKGAIDPLIKVGAFDTVDGCGNMKVIHTLYGSTVENRKLLQKKHRSELLSILDKTVDEVKEDYPIHEKVQFENDLLGFSLRGSAFEILDRDKKIHEILGEASMSLQEFISSDLEVGVLPVVVKDIRERAQRNGQMMAFVKFAGQTGEEFDAPCFATIWKWIGPIMKKGSVYFATFNRRDDDPEGLIIGRPGFAHSQNSSIGYMIDIDEVKL